MEAEVPENEKILRNKENPIEDRISALFYLRTVGSVSAVQALFSAFEEEDASELLKHEICYCLGQMNKGEEQTKLIQQYLEKLVEDDNKQTKIVLHEAVEALGNLNQDNTLKLLKKFENEPSDILYETCFLTLKLIEWRKAT